MDYLLIISGSGRNVGKTTLACQLIEKYQKDDLPITKPLEEYSKQLNKTAQYADSLTKN